jgi:hypothetical protein
MAGLVPRIPRLRFPGKLPDGNRLLKLFLEWHLLHMVVDEFLKTLSDSYWCFPEHPAEQTSPRTGLSRRQRSMLGHIDGIDCFGLQSITL